MMPKKLLLLRHAQSEGNFAEDNPELERAIAEVPNNELRLSLEGIRQANKTGDWLRPYLEDDKIPYRKTVGFVSTFVRAKETAGNLRLGLDWQPTPFIVERDWGHFNRLTAEEQERYKKGKKRNPLYCPMPNGQSLSSLLAANYLFFGALHREHSEDRIVAVCHGERLLTIRYQLERMTDKRFSELIRSLHTGDKIRNCQIIEYSRITPDGSETTSYQWMRSFCPWDPRDKDLKWKKIVKTKMSDDDLLKYAESFPRYIVPTV